ncbi:hypothetical protein [Brevundimonas sp. R86498]|uniref:hypothetical protein n=1 Tax=Brevundimonas sp. R86498 TaxID=3093845 RepID=UPI0037CA1EEC
MSEPFEPRQFGKAARNEQRKLLATTLNTIGLAVFGIGFVTPVLSAADDGSTLSFLGVWTIFGLAHLVAQRVLRDLEE